MFQAMLCFNKDFLLDNTICTLKQIVIVQTILQIKI